MATKVPLAETVDLFFYFYLTLLLMSQNFTADVTLGIFVHFMFELWQVLRHKAQKFIPIEMERTLVCVH